MCAVGRRGIPFRRHVIFHSGFQDSTSFKLSRMLANYLYILGFVSDPQRVITKPRFVLRSGAVTHEYVSIVCSPTVKVFHFRFPFAGTFVHWNFSQLVACMWACFHFPLTASQQFNKMDKNFANGFTGWDGNHVTLEKSLSEKGSP